MSELGQRKMGNTEKKRKGAGKQNGKSRRKVKGQTLFAPHVGQKMS